MVRFGGAGPGGSYIFIRVIKAANGARARARRQRLSGMTAASTIFFMIQQLLVYPTHLLVPLIPRHAGGGDVSAALGII